MKKSVKGLLVDMTAEEIAEYQEWQEEFEAAERTRPLTLEEVSRMLVANQINTLSVDDSTALRMKEFYPEWEAGQDYPEGYKVQYGGVLYKVLQAHTAQEDWTPETAPALWTQICESHAGTLADPIPYSGSMALEAGLYYSQSGVTYLCVRDTVDPVYSELSELLGLYVEKGA